VRLDLYYCDQSDLTQAQRAAVNYDHPNAFDWALLDQHIEQLCAGHAIPVPVYDFAGYTRTSDVTWVQPAQVVLVEGILTLYEPSLRSRMDLKVFVDADPDVRFIRRLERDIAERGRTATSVISQYLTTVRPMHLQFVEPTKRYADVIVPHGGHNLPALDMLLARIRELTRL
jgi:uridine kinase